MQLRRIAAALTLSLLVADHGLAVPTLVWTGAVSSDAANGGNWVGNSPPNAGDSLSFGDLGGGASSVVTLPGAFTFSVTDIGFNGSARPAYTFGGSTGSVLQLAGNVSTATAGGLATFGSSVELNLSAGTHTVALATGGDIQVAGVVSGAGGISKSGTGTLTLLGTNTYSGPTTIAGGILSIRTIANGGVASGLGSSSNSAANLVLDGGTLEIGAGSTGALSTDRLFTLGTAGGTIDDASGFAVDFSNGGTIALAGTNTARTLTLTGSGSATPASTFAPIIGDNGTGKTSLVKSGGSQNWLLTGNNTYTGTTTISAGTLSIPAIFNGGVPSGIGASSSAASSLIMAGGTLSIGSNSTSDRLFTLTGPGKISVQGAVTFSNTGNIAYSGTGILSLGFFGASGSVGTFNPVIGDGLVPVSVLLSTTGKWVLNGQNTYTSSTSLSPGTLSVSSLANGGMPSNIGASSSAAANLVLSNNGVLQYVGPGATTDRLFTLSFGGGTIESSGTGALVFSNPGAIALDLNNFRTLTLAGTNTNTNTLTPIVGNTGNAGAVMVAVSKTGVGTWALDGLNTYTGATSITGGTLIVRTLQDGGISSSIGASSDAASNLIFSGGKLVYTGPVTSTNRLFTLGTNSGTIEASGTGALTFSNGNPIAFSGGTARTLTLGGTGSGFFSPQIINNTSGLTSLIKTGTGTWVLTGSNTYTGPTTITGGTLSISADANLGAAPGSPTPGSLVLNAGTLNTTATFALSANRGITIGPGSSVFNTNTGTTFSIGGIITGTAALQKTGAGTLVLSGSNTYTGGTTISGGTLVIGAANTLPTSGTVTTSSGTTLDVQNSQTVSFLSGSGSVNLAGGATLTVSGTSGSTFSGNISGAGGLAKNGSGALTLSGNNGSFSGPVSLTGAGNITLAGASSVGTGAWSINGGTLGVSGSFAAAMPITLGTGNNGININTGVTLTHTGVMSGAGGFTKVGLGTLTLLNQSTFAGTTGLTGGTLRVAAVNALPVTTLVNFTGVGPVLDLQSSQTIAGFGTGIGTGTILIGSGTTLTIAGTSNSSSASTIGGNGSLLKTGGGTLTLSGTNSDFTGGTVVSGGILMLGAGSGVGTPGSAGIGTIAVEANGTLAPASDDISIGNAVLVHDGATLGSPAGDDRLEFTGAVTAASTTTRIRIPGDAQTIFAGTIGGPAGTTLTFDNTGIARIAGTTLSSIAGFTSDGGRLIFFTPSSLGSATVRATNGGYVGLGLSSGSGLAAGALLARITDKPGFNGTFGFDFDKESGGPGTIVSENLDFSGFTNPAFQVGSTSAALVAGRITPPSTGYVFGSVQGALLVLDSNLDAPTGVSVRSPGDGFLTIFRGQNSYTGPLAVNNAAVLLDSAKALPTGSPVALGGTFAYLGATEAFRSASDFVAFFANPANVTVGAGTQAVIGFDPHTSLEQLLFDDRNRTARVITSALDLSPLAPGTYLGTISRLSLQGTVTAPGNGALKLSGSGEGRITISSNLTAGNVASLTLGSAAVDGNDSVFALTGANTFTGNTTLEAGTVALGTSSNLGGGNGPLGLGSLVVASGAPEAALASASVDNGTRSTWASREVILENGIVLNSNLQLGQTAFENDDSFVEFNKARFSQLVLSGAVSGTGGLRIENGRTLLTGSNTFSGGTTSINGVLILGNAGSLSPSSQLLAAPGYIGIGFVPGNIQTGFLDRFDKAGSNGTIGLDSLSGGGTLAGAPAVNNFTGAMDLTGFSSSARIGTATSAILSGAVTPASGGYRFGGGGGTLTVATALSGSRNLVLDSSGDIPLTLRLTGANTYTQGTQAIQSALVFAAGAIPASGSFSNLFSGSYIGTEDSSLAFSSYFNRFPTSMASGIIGFDTAPAGPTFTISSNLDLATRFTGTSPNFYIGSSSRLLIGSAATITLPGGTSTYRFAGYKGGVVEVDATLSGSRSVAIGDPNASATHGFGGVYSAVQLDGANTYSGGTTLYAGLLSLGGNQALGTGTLTVQPMNFSDDGVAAELQAASSSVIPNAIVLNTDLAIGDGSFTLSGVISGAANAFGELGELYKRGAGTLTLSGNNTFGGGIYIREGAVEFASNTAAGTGELQLGGPSSPIASFTTLAPVIHGLSARSATDQVQLQPGATLTINQSRKTEFAGTIQGGTGTSIAKTGSGELVLGSANTYTGTTAVYGGALIAAANGAFGSSSIFLDGGGIGARAGVTISNPISFGSGGGFIGGSGSFGATISAGSGIALGAGSSTGTLALTGGLVLASGGTLVVEVQDAAGTAGSGYDLVAVSGMLAGPGTSVDVSATAGSPFLIQLKTINGSVGADAANFNASIINTWTIMTAASGISGFDSSKFIINTSGFSNDLGGGGFSVASTGTALELTFTPVPEPSTWAMMAAGAAAVAGAGLRRRRKN